MSTHAGGHEPQRPVAVVAMGGHAFVMPGQRGTHDQAAANTEAMCAEIIKLVERGYDLVLTHGNGPQVGDLLERVELTRDQVPAQPLDVLVAQTEGSLGYLLQRALLNELRRRSIRRYVVTVVTQVLVDRDDPAFADPQKPVGPVMAKAQAEQRAREFGWQVADDGRGWRRVVPSPRPTKVIQRHMIRDAVEAGHLVIAAGGGGVPMAKDASGDYVGVEAVIDKDLTSSVLATDVGADLLIILTATDGAYLDWGQPTQRRLGAVTMAECRRYIDAGHFPPGSMGPKVEAIYGFLQRGGRRGLITDATSLLDALDGQAGTHFVGRI